MEGRSGQGIYHPASLVETHGPPKGGRSNEGVKVNPSLVGYTLVPPPRWGCTLVPPPRWGTRRKPLWRKDLGQICARRFDVSAYAATTYDEYVWHSYCVSKWYANGEEKIEKFCQKILTIKSEKIC